MHCDGDCRVAALLAMTGKSELSAVHPIPWAESAQVDFAKFGPITSIIGRAGAPISHNNGPDVCSGE
jgi:hypothetical protein